MLFYPSPRLAIAALALIGLAAGGYFYAPLFDAAGWGAIAGAIVALTDLALTTRELNGKLQLTRDFPAVSTVAQPRLGRHVLANGSRLPLRVQVHEDELAYVSKQVDPRWRRVRARGSADWPVAMTHGRRGEQELGGAGLRVLAGLELWVLQYRCEWRERVRVYPLIEELTRGDLFAHRRRLWGIGQHQSRKFGRGTEFDQLREYTPDDEYRNINWKATARFGEPVVNQYQVEQARDVMLLVDCGRLMVTEIAGRPRLDRYLDAAVHLAYIALRQKDRVGLIAFDAVVRKFVPPARNPRQLDNLIDAMFDLEPRFVESDYARAVTLLKARQPKRGLAVLFTDLVDSISSRQAVANLTRLAHTHLPLLVVLDDPAVPALAEVPVGSASDAYVQATVEQMLAEKRRTVSQLRQGGCIIVNPTAERLNTALVDQYLQVKARNLL